MTKPQNQPDQYEVVIPDHVMAQVKDLPPEAYDELAAAIAQIKEDPDSVGRPIVPFPVDHSEGREPVYVPAARSVSYLRGAVADISPPTVAVFDQELAEDVTGDSPDVKTRALRSFLLRWIEYIALTGDPATGRYLDEADTPDEYASRFAETMERIHREHFPDADGHSFAVRVNRDGSQWRAVCPVTMIRVDRPTEAEAELALSMALLELVTGY
ncbi:hypothetical protein AB0M39_35095 [Streptomyces sp. NPDC051907]|uniref:hypothetical protein n=1 Tax=Streptomyces sp. NPDC051907 TaxID=3155284 RepID=UPI00344050D7